MRTRVLFALFCWPLRGRTNHFASSMADCGFRLSVPDVPWFCPGRQVVTLVGRVHGWAGGHGTVPGRDGPRFLVSAQGLTRTLSLCRYLMVCDANVRTSQSGGRDGSGRAGRSVMLRLAIGEGLTLLFRLSRVLGGDIIGWPGASIACSCHFRWFLGAATAGASAVAAIIRPS